MGRGRGWVTAACAGVLVGCFEYSPHEHRLDASETALHARALARLEATPPPAVVRFAVIGDTQLAFDEAEDAIDDLSRRGDVAFAVQIGDYTNFGLVREYRLMNEIFERLPIPWFVVVGIHDHLGNGNAIYEHMFGPRDLAFTWARTRFVLFESNSLEFGFDGSVPDLGWLAEALAPDGTADRAVLFSHVAPGRGDFDPALVEPYLALLRASGPALSIHGHEHRYEEEVREGVPIYVADAIDGRSYLLVTLRDGGAFEVERVRF